MKFMESKQIRYLLIIISLIQMVKKIYLGQSQVDQIVDMVEGRLDNLEKDVALIKQCPTIKQELNNLYINENN